MLGFAAPQGKGQFVVEGAPAARGQGQGQLQLYGSCIERETTPHR